MIRCAIYDRVSTDEQVRYGLSLDTQRDDLAAYAKEHDYLIVGCYSDEGITARKKMQNRKDLMRLLEDVKSDKIDLILVTKLDRWFRNVKDYHNTQAILEQHHCGWKTIYEDYDSSTADGQLKINIMLAVAQNECDRTSERIKAVFKHKKSQGKVISSMSAPYGYRVTNGFIEKDDAVSHIVEDAYYRYRMVRSIKQVYTYLCQTYGESAPSFNKVDRLFKNTKYYGYYDGNSNFCDPYITKKEFATFANRSTYRIDMSEPYIFGGLIICPVCGIRMGGFTKKQKLKNGGASHYKRYRCVRKYNKHPGACPSEKVIEEYIISHLVMSIDDELSTLNAEREKVKNQPNLDGVKKELERLNSMYQKGRISEQHYDREYDELSKKLSSYSNITEIENRIAHVTDMKRFFEKDFLCVYQSLDSAHKKAFWRKYIKEIHIDESTHRPCGFILN